MAIHVECSCGTKLKAEEKFAGKRAECPLCGKWLDIGMFFEEEDEDSESSSPFAEDAEEVASDFQKAISDESTEEETPQAKQAAELVQHKESEFWNEISDYIDPPGVASTQQEVASSPEEKKPSALLRMFEALLDPRSIQWMLLLGGALAVIGLLVWLISIGIFENVKIVAVCLGIGTLLILGTGWWLKLKTKFHVAGQAVTFLGCVVMPLNLWFYHAQELILVTQHLWLGGVVCCLFYFATVKVLRDPLFLYAAEAGITMTVLLLLADMGKLTDSTHFSLYMVVLGLISLHIHHLFSKDATDYPVEKYGTPFFRSGQVQILVALSFLFAFQTFSWAVASMGSFPPLRYFFSTSLDGYSINIASQPLLACGLWLAGIYAALYSSLLSSSFVKRSRWATICASFSLGMAEVSLFDALNIGQEGVIAFLAGTALLLHLINQYLLAEKKEFEPAITAMALGLSSISILWALMLHFGAINVDYSQHFPSLYQFTWAFVIVTLFSAVSFRVIQIFTFRIQMRVSATYFFLSAAAVMLSASALLHLAGWEHWSHRAPVLILIPFAYLVGSRFWRGKFPEVPLYWVSHVGTAVVLLHVFWASILQGKSILDVTPGSKVSLLLGLLFLEALAFYALAAWFRRRANNLYFAAASLCGAIWQFFGYYDISKEWYVILYAVLGMLGLFAARMMGVAKETRFNEHGDEKQVIRGAGLAFYQSGNGILLVTLFTAFLQAGDSIGLSYQNAAVVEFAGWLPLLSLFSAILAGLAGIALSFNGGWKRFYIVGTLILSAQIFILLNVLINLSGWQKLEIFCVTVGVALLIASHLGLFREEEQVEARESTDGSQKELISFGLFIGSLMAVVPLLVATFHFHFLPENVFTLDDFFLITICVLMLVTGFSWKVRSTTLIAGIGLAIYLTMIIAIIAYNPQIKIGVYLGIGGLFLFGIGIVLSMYRERLLQIPDRISNREGIFKIIDWR